MIPNAVAKGTGVMRSVLEAWPSITMPSRLQRYRSDCEGMSESDAFKMIGWLEIGESQELAER